jgi:fimbrial isopeptide formation D2 family protein
MQTGGSLGLMARRNKGLVLFLAALLVFSMALFATAAAAPRPALAAAGDPVVTLEDGVNGCNGVRPTPGSENTNKRLVGGSLIPGGSATFEISYPVDPEDVAGRETFVITDCVFIGGKAVLKYSVSFVPNTENFILTFTLQIPPGTPIGAEYCNYAKTTAAPSESQASNRKAGPACFIVGGNISVLKVDEDGNPLAGAKFHIECDFPTTQAFLPDTIINGENFNSTSGGHIETDVTTGANGLIAIQAPEGTSCLITETEAPDGYDLADPDHVTLVATAGGVDHTFVNPKSFVPEPGLSVTKGVSLDAAGPFEASLTTTVGTTVYYRIVITNTGNIELTGVTLEDSIFDLAGLGCDVPDTLAVGEDFTCNYTSAAVVGTTENTATGDSEETGPEDDTATVIVEAAPGFTVDKGVWTDSDGPFVDEITVQIGTTVYYRITITNTGNVDLSGVTLSDSVYDLVAKGCTIPTTLAVGASFDCDYSAVVTTDTTNVATGDTDQTGPDDGTAIVNVTPLPPPPTLTVEKTNNAPIVNVGGTGLPTAEEGDTVTFTLSYTSQNGSVSNATLEDVIPAGLTYVTGSATNSSEFTFAGYDSATRTLSWTAATVSANGSVTYQATVDEGAAELEQPLENVATIDSDDTEPDSDTSEVFVPEPPLAETSVPTAPRTDVLDSGGTSAPGMGMGLLLLVIGVLTLAVVFVTPMPATVRNRNRRR